MDLFVLTFPIQYGSELLFILFQKCLPFCVILLTNFRAFCIGTLLSDVVFKEGPLYFLLVIELNVKPFLGFRSI